MAQDTIVPNDDDLLIATSSTAILISVCGLTTTDQRVSILADKMSIMTAHHLARIRMLEKALHDISFGREDV